MINPALLDDEVQKFIEQQINVDINKLILKGSPFKHIDAKELATQIQAKKSIQKKLPTWVSTKGVVFPPKLNLEQASSELSAQYKSKLINSKDELVDITGGFGIDDYYFSKVAKKVFHCEINPDLSEIAQHNVAKLGADNISFFQGDGNTYLKSISKTDVIYTDPSRRANAGRVFLLEDCEPDIIKNLDFYLCKAPKIILKAAPMLDIEAAIQALKKVSEVHVVSVNNECKELLFVIERTIKPTQIICALLTKEDTNTYKFPYQAEKSQTITYSKLKNYLYEPDVAFLKAGLFKTIASHFKVEKLNPNSHLYTSEDYIADFPGRTLKIVEDFAFSNFKTGKNYKKANVITRNFPLKPEEIKKKLKIADGGNLYLYFTTDKNDKQIVVVAERQTN